MKFTKILGCIAAALSCAFLNAAEIETKPDGSLKIGGLNSYIEVVTNAWVGCSPGKPGLFKADTPDMAKNGNIRTLSGDIGNLKGGDYFRFTEKVVMLNDHTAELDFSLKSRKPAGVPCRRIYLAIRVPEKDLKGRKIVLNGEETEWAPNDTPQEAAELEFESNGRKFKITGEFSYSSGAGWGTASIRIGFTPYNETITESALNCTVEVKRQVNDPVSLRGTAKTTGYKERAELAKKLDVNLKALPLKHGEIVFSPKQFLKLGAGESVKVALKTAAPYIYLLHSTSPDAKPEMTVVGKDSSRKTVKLEADRDFSTKRPRMRCVNAAAVSSTNDTFEGVDFSKFDLGDAEALEFANNGSGTWVIAAATVSSLDCPPEKTDSRFFEQANDEWLYVGRYAAPEAGSVLDFSWAIDHAPAGKYGWIKLDKEGHFTFENAPEKRMRILGTNLSFHANFPPSHEAADKLADDLMRAGYNSVRIHHYDNQICESADKFIPEQVEKLDYLFAALKKRGFYITIDLYSARRWRGEELKEIAAKHGTQSMKLLVYVLPEVRENLKTFARNLLTHVNPYTGMTWAEDPALFGIDLINEGQAGLYYTKNPNTKALYENLYYDYLKKHGIDTPETRAETADTPEPGKCVNFKKFMVSLDHNLFEDFSALLRSFGFKGLINNHNFLDSTRLSMSKHPQQWIDKHIYNDHPVGWAVPRRYAQQSALLHMAHVPRCIMPSRVYGKAFTSTEINWPYPNHCRAEYGPLVGAYSGLQDWDGIWRFEWANFWAEISHDFPMAEFDTCTDINSQAAERVLALYFLQNRVKRAPSAIALPFGAETLKKGGDIWYHTSPVAKLGLYCRVGNIHEKENFPGVKKLSMPLALDKDLSPAEMAVVNSSDRVMSETGEIEINGKGSFRLMTPTAESLILAKGGSLKGKCLQMSNASPTYHTLTAATLDKKNFAASGSILVIHQTTASANHTHYQNESRTSVFNYGKPEILIRKGSADITLKTGNGNYIVEAIGFDGQPKGTVKSELKNGVLTFTADTALFGGTFYYLISKK